MEMSPRSGDLMSSARDGFTGSRHKATQASINRLGASIQFSRSCRWGGPIVDEQVDESVCGIVRMGTCPPSPATWLTESHAAEPCLCGYLPSGPDGSAQPERSFSQYPF